MDEYCKVEMLPLDSKMTFFRNMSEYLQVKISCLSSYRTEHHVRRELQECSDHLKNWPSNLLLMRMENTGDPESMLDMAIRFVPHHPLDYRRGIVS